MIIDVHIHCFPDDLAEKAVSALEKRARTKAAGDGSLGGLRRSMTGAAIGISVVQHIVNKPGQELTVNKWAASIQSAGQDSAGDGSLISFGSIHPNSTDWPDQLRRLIDLGLKGVKFHPDYQGFYVDEPRMFPIYEAICAAGLPVLFHAGIDLGLPGPCHGRPENLKMVIDHFPEGKWIAAHMGGYLCWDKVKAHLCGAPVYLDTSYAFEQIGPDGMRELILMHGPERILFGSDWPWAAQAEAVAQIRSLGLPAEQEKAILSGNARNLLGI